ncbi:HIT family protein [Nonomuraea antimicrobica]
MPSADRRPFCDYLAGLSPASILERGKQVAILVTRWQRGQGHVLVIPVAHRPTVMDVAPAEEQQLMDAVRRAAQAITAAYDPGASPFGRTTGCPRTRPSPMCTSMSPALCPTVARGRGGPSSRPR